MSDFERAPLLDIDERWSGSEASETAPDNVKTSKWKSAKEFWIRWKAIILCASLITTLELPTKIVAAPTMRLLELGVCRDMYGDNINDSVCSGKDVQARVARAWGIIALLGMLPSLLLAIPYGMLADSRGRRFVVSLTVFAASVAYAWYFMVLYWYKTFPFWMVYLGPLWLCIGGGGFVAGSVISAMAADVASDQNRTRIFFFFGVISTFVDMLAPQIGAALMRWRGPYMALLVTIALSPVPLIPLYFMPETAPSLAKLNTAVNGDEASKQQFSIRTQMSDTFKYMKKDLLPILGSFSVLRGVFCLLLVTFASAMGGLILQYMHVRFGWSYEKTTVVLSYQAFVHVVLLCTVLPFFHTFLMNRYAAVQADLILCKISILFACIGTLVMGLSRTPIGVFIAIIIGTFATGFGAALKSFLTSLVPKEEVALLYTIIAISATVGTMAGTPVLSLALAGGIQAGGMWIGLPLLIACAMYMLSAVSIWTVRAPAKRDDEEAEES